MTIEFSTVLAMLATENAFFEAKTKCMFTTLFTRISIICSQVQTLSIVSVSEMNLNVIFAVLNTT